MFVLVCVVGGVCVEYRGAVNAANGASTQPVMLLNGLLFWLCAAAFMLEEVVSKWSHAPFSQGGDLPLPSAVFITL